MKKGDILINRWASDPECRYFIYTHSSGRSVFGINYFRGRLRKVSYYTHSLKENLDDGTPVFEVVGHSNVFEMIKKDLKDIIALREED